MHGDVRLHDQQGVSADRRGVCPIVIVNDGAIRRSNSDSVPVHFTVWPDGTIHQHLDVERSVVFEPDQLPNAASLDKAGEAAQVVMDHPTLHPASYSVIIGYEGSAGRMTEEQFLSSLSLHETIRYSVATRYGIWFPLNRYHVIPLARMFSDCPDDSNFPWERLYDDLAQTDEEYAAQDTIAAVETLIRRGLLG